MWNILKNKKINKFLYFIEVALINKKKIIQKMHKNL